MVEETKLDKILNALAASRKAVEKKKKFDAGVALPQPPA